MFLSIALLHLTSIANISSHWKNQLCAGAVPTEATVDFTSTCRRPKYRMQNIISGVTMCLCYDIEASHATGTDLYQSRIIAPKMQLPGYSLNVI